MLKDKRGLSAVVTTLIIVLLVLVAIGIVWAVVQGVVDEGAEEIDIRSKCLQVDIEINKVTCNIADPKQCVVDLERGPGGDAFSGVKFVFRDGANSGSPVNHPGNIDPFATDTTDSLNSELTAPKTVDAFVYFLDSSGAEQICTGATEFTI